MADNGSIMLELLRDLKKNQEEHQKEVHEEFKSQRVDMKELRQSIDKLDKTMAVELQKIHKTDEQQNALLAEHSQRSTELKRQNDLTRAQVFGTPEMTSQQRSATVVGRIENLEAPGKWWKMTKKGLLGLAGVIGALMVILKFLGML